MSGLLTTLYTASSGLRASQIGVQTAGANVANAATPGYSTRRVELAPATSTQLSGVQVVSVSRADEPFLRQAATRASVRNAYAETRSSLLEAIEGSLAPVSGSRIALALESFASSATTLASDPSSTAARQSFLGEADAVAQSFRATADDILALEQGVEKKMVDATARATQLGRQLADLNKRISTNAGATDEPSALLDQRDGVAKALASIVGGDVLSDGRGNLNVSALGTMIVSGNESLSVGTSTNAITGGLDVYVSGYGAEKTVVTSRATLGELGALSTVRNRDLVAQQSALDQQAFDFQTGVNSAHQAGPGGRALFLGASSSAGAASALQLDGSLTPSLVDAGLTAQPGDNRTALAIAQLDFSGAERDRAVALASAANNAVAEQDDAGAQFLVSEGLLARATSVSTDDELIQLTLFQRAYQASAKVISTVDEMLDTLVRL